MSGEYLRTDLHLDPCSVAQLALRTSPTERIRSNSNMRNVSKYPPGYGGSSMVGLMGIEPKSHAVERVGYGGERIAIIR
jgi:hypothetical protein